MIMSNQVDPKDVSYSIGKPLTEEEFRRIKGEDSVILNKSKVVKDGVNKNSKFLRDLVVGETVDDYGKVVFVEPVGRMIKVMFDTDKELLGFNNMLVTVKAT
jgi:hypothetical protein